MLGLLVKRSAWLVNRDTKVVHSGVGNKALSATLDRLRLTTMGRTDTFDDDPASILVE